MDVDIRKHSVRKPPTSFQKPVGGYETTSDILVYNFQLLYKYEHMEAFHFLSHAVWGDIWQVPLERNTTDSTDRPNKKNMTDI